MMNLYRAIVERMRKSGYFTIHPVMRRVVVQGFIGTMVLSAPFFWGWTIHWPLGPVALFVISVVKEFIDDRNSGLPMGEYMMEHSFKHLLQAWGGLLVAVFILIAVATNRGIL